MCKLLSEILENTETPGWTPRDSDYSGLGWQSGLSMSLKPPRHTQSWAPTGPQSSGWGKSIMLQMNFCPALTKMKLVQNSELCKELNISIEFLTLLSQVTLLNPATSVILELHSHTWLKKSRAWPWRPWSKLQTSQAGALWPLFSLPSLQELLRNRAQSWAAARLSGGDSSVV